jgi:glucans biosynthesis protein C
MAIDQLAILSRHTEDQAVEALPRLAYIDSLRVAVIAFVVVHHAAQAYGSVGNLWSIPNPTEALILRPFLVVNASFGMGLMFLLAGYLTPHAFDHHGGRGLLRDRTLRLVVPLLLISLGLLFPYAYVTRGRGQPLLGFLVAYLRQPEIGHMWFAAVLFVFTVGYVLWRTFAQNLEAAPSRVGDRTVHVLLLGVVCWVWLTSYLVRLVYPVGRLVPLVPFVQIELARLPQYLSLFVLGCVAFRGDWFQRLPTTTGTVWLALGLTAGAIPYMAALFAPYLPFELPMVPRNGVGIDALLWDLVEAFICIGLSVGLVTLFRERVNQQSKLLDELAAASYTVYVVHLLPVLSLQLLLSSLSWPPLLKFAMVAGIALPTSFSLSIWLHKLLWLKPILG